MSTTARNSPPAQAPCAPARNWVEISTDALRANLRYVRRKVPAATAICAVVKADAYGHGAAECARVFDSEGVRWLAVTSPEEGARLRMAGLVKPRILVLAGFASTDADLLVEHRLTPAVWDEHHIAWLAAALDRATPEPFSPTSFAIHLKVETGMGRLGITPEQEPVLLDALRREPRLQVEAVFSHLAASESADESDSRRQHARFLAARKRLAFGATGAHLLNSEGALRYADWGETMVRTGLALYGYSSNPLHAPQLRPALSWKSRIVSVKELPAGHAIGYGSTFHAPAPMRIATLAVGYADGYRRQFWPGAHVLIAGRRARVVGNISMDLTTVDITTISPMPNVGDEAVLLGQCAVESITAADLAACAGTIPYEILCGLSARVERVYRD